MNSLHKMAPDRATTLLLVLFFSVPTCLSIPNNFEFIADETVTQEIFNDEKVFVRSKRETEETKITVSDLASATKLNSRDDLNFR